MEINCIWEHNGADSLLYAENFIGAFSRGESLEVAEEKMLAEIQSYLNWLGESVLEDINVVINQEKESGLEIKDADNEGAIFECRQRGFELLEQKENFLANSVIKGSYGEIWTLRKMIRRFIWHDRIHAKAMWRMAKRTFPEHEIQNIFCF